MKFFKPVVSGLGALIAAALLTSAPLFVSMLRYPVRDGYFFVIHWHVWAAPCMLALVFLSGFYWQYRKAR